MVTVKTALQICQKKGEQLKEAIKEGLDENLHLQECINLLYQEMEIEKKGVNELSEQNKGFSCSNTSSVINIKCLHQMLSLFSCPYILAAEVNSTFR